MGHLNLEKNILLSCSKVSEWYFVTQIVLTYCEKQLFYDREKLLKFEAEGREFAKKFVIGRTIYSNRKRSEQFLVTEYFFNMFLEVSQI